MAGRFKSTKLDEYIALRQVESGQFTISVPVRISPEEKNIILVLSYLEYGKPNVSRYIRENLEKTLFKNRSDQSLKEALRQLKHETGLELNYTEYAKLIQNQKKNVKRET